jgi:hypothetical protein
MPRACPEDKYIIAPDASSSAQWTVKVQDFVCEGFMTRKDAAAYIRSLHRAIACLSTSSLHVDLSKASRRDVQTSAKKQKKQKKDEKRRTENQADPCELFGARLMLKRTKRSAFEFGVVKTFWPCTTTYGVAFDDAPHKVVQADLRRRDAKMWYKVQWEGDIMETSHLRPNCPTCGISMGEGRAAWTLCKACNMSEPGVSSDSMFGRVRNDTYRQHPINYNEVDSDADN